MKISDLIQDLEDALLAHGDMGVITCNKFGEEFEIEDTETGSNLTGSCFVIHTEANG